MEPDAQARLKETRPGYMLLMLVALVSVLLAVPALFVVVVSQGLGQWLNPGAERTEIGLCRSSFADPECTDVPMSAIESYSGIDFPAGSRIIDSAASPSAASFGGLKPTLWAIMELPNDVDAVSDFLEPADIPLGGLDNPDAASPLTELGSTDVVGRQNDQGARYAGILDGRAVVYVLAILEPAPEL
jgi:hypothetical protein